MKRYIKPECEIIDVMMESHLLGVSPVEADVEHYNDEVGDGVWLAPKRRSVDAWDEE